RRLLPQSRAPRAPDHRTPRLPPLPRLPLLPHRVPARRVPETARGAESGLGCLSRGDAADGRPGHGASRRA
ncbi:hypothetical protein LTS18_014612, partial [Coniosporium uncinatum]